MIHTISFKDTVTASTVKTLASKQIGFPFKFSRIHIYFPLGSDLLTQYRVYSSYDDNAPSSGEPSGINIFGTLGQVNYIVGANGWITIIDQTVVRERGTFIKVYMNNTDSADHTLVCVIEIDDDIGE